MIPQRISPLRWRMAADSAWPGFTGHFPGDPILPAAEIVDAALRCCEAEGHAVTGVERARFTAPVRPGDVLELAIEPRAGMTHVRCTIAGTSVAELLLRDGDGQG